MKIELDLPTDLKVMTIYPGSRHGPKPWYILLGQAVTHNSYVHNVYGSGKGEDAQEALTEAILNLNLEIEKLITRAPPPKLPTKPTSPISLEDLDL